MPKTLSNRLEDLENEIQVLLTLQNGIGNCNIKGATVTHTNSNNSGKNKRIVFEAIQFKEASRISLPLQKQRVAKTRPLTSPASSTTHQSQISDVFYTCNNSLGDSLLKSRSAQKLITSFENIPKICPPLKVPLITSAPTKESGKCMFVTSRNKVVKRIKNEVSNSDTTKVEKPNYEGDKKKKSNKDVKKADKIEICSDKPLHYVTIPNTSQINAISDSQSEQLTKTQDLVEQLKKDLGKTIVELSKAELEKRTALTKSQELSDKLEKINKNQKLETIKEKPQLPTIETQTNTDVETKSIALSKAELENKTPLAKCLELSNKLQVHENQKLETIKETSVALVTKTPDDLVEIDERSTLMKITELARELEEITKLQHPRSQIPSPSFTIQVPIKTQKEKKDENSIKPLKNIKKRTNKLKNADDIKDEQTKQISAELETILERISEKEKENKNMEIKLKEVVDSLKECESTNQNLRDTNALLLKHVKDIKLKLKTEQKQVGKLEVMVEELKINITNNMQKSELKELETQTAKDTKYSKDIETLKSKLTESKKREQIYLDEAAILEVRLQKIQSGQAAVLRNAEQEVSKIKKEQSKLQFKLEEAEEKLHMSENKYEKDIQTLQNECKTKCKKLNEKYESALMENEELRFNLDEIINENESYKGLRLKNEDLASLLKSKDSVLFKLENELLLKKRENDDLREQVRQLTVQVDLLQQTFDAYEDSNDEVERQMEELRLLLEEKQCQLLMRDQTIENQQSMITKLQDEIENNDSRIKTAMDDTQSCSIEARKIAEEMHTVSMELDKEIEHQQGLCSLPKMERSAITKPLREKVQKLEKALTQVQELCKHTPTNDDKHKKLMTLVESLEKKANLVRKETALRMQLLTKQKEQAIHAARFATNKLNETVSDFQNQVEVHKKVQIVLTNMLQDRDNNELRSASSSDFENTTKQYSRKRNQHSMRRPMEQCYAKSNAKDVYYRSSESDVD